MAGAPGLPQSLAGSVGLVVGLGVDGGEDGAGDLGEVGVAGDVGGHGVDEVAEGTEPDAGGDRGGGGRGDVDLAGQLDHADRAEDPDVGYPGTAAGRR